MKRILSFIMTVSVIVSMLCIGTVPASAFDANQGNDVYFYSPPMRLSDVEFTEHTGNRKSFYLTYYLYVNPEKYWGTTGGVLIITINGGTGFIDFFNTRNPGSSLSSVMLSTEPNPDDDPDAYSPMTFGTAEMQTWDTKYGENLESAILVDFYTRDENVDPLEALQEGNPYGKEAGQIAEFKVRYMVTDYEAFVQAVNNKTLSFTVDLFTNREGNQNMGMFPREGNTFGKPLSLGNKEYPAPKPENFQFTVDDPQPATDPYYNYTGDDANGYTITFTDAYKNAILNNTDYTSDDGVTYWSANDPIKNPQYNGKTVSSAANLFSSMALSKVDLSEFNLSDTAMSNMFAGFLGTGDGIPAVGIAADDAAATKYNLTDTGIDKTTLYFGNVTILNYNDASGYSYVYDDRATTDTDEATTAVTIGNAGNNKQFVNIKDQYFAGFENPDRTDALVTIDYSDAVKTKDLDVYLTTNQTSDKNSNALRLLLNAKDNAPSGVNLSKAMAQKVTKADGSNSIRFIALIDAGYAKYQETGFVLSGVGMNPTRQAGYQYKSTNTIYKKLRALDTTGGKGAVLMDMEKLNGLFSFTGVGFEYTELKIPLGKEGVTYYATPYIILEDGTVVYGETRATSFNALVVNDQKSVE